LSDRSGIEWTQATWNPVTGCTKVSEGCMNCYAERLSERLRRMGNPKYRNGFEVTLHPDALDLPLKWSRPRTIFVDSMGDLFHEAVPVEFILRAISTMAQTPHHTYQILTKRSSRLVEIVGGMDLPRNVWVGVSVESSQYLSRLEDLKRVKSCVRFVSFEPLLGPIQKVDLSHVDWAIVGGESGPGARPVAADWIRDLRDQCTEAHVAFFFKQWGGVRRTAAGRLLDGRTWDEVPCGCGRDRRDGRSDHVASAV